MPSRDTDDNNQQYLSYIKIIVCLIGVIFVCVGISIFANESEQTDTRISNNQIIDVQATITMEPIIPVIETPSVIVTVPDERRVILNYTYNSNPYRMSVPLDNKLESVYNNHEPVYVCMKYNNDKSDCTTEEYTQYYKSYINDRSQQGALNDIVRTIQGITNDTDDQARIAISLVQQIPYDDWNSRNISHGPDMRYPYQVIYEYKGVCSDKSLLMASLLQKLGYNVSLFHFKPEKHMAVGISVPIRHSYNQTGYAFVESTSPSIISDMSRNYTGIGKLSSVPTIYVISDGKSMDTVYEEYVDLNRYNTIVAMGVTLPEKEYREWNAISKKYGLVYKD